MRKTSLLVLLALAACVGCGSKEEASPVETPRTLTPPPRASSSGQAASPTPTGAPDAGVNPAYSGSGGLGSKAPR